MIELKKDDAGGPRFHVDHKPLHCGEFIVVRWGDDTWTRMRFEWSHAEDRPVVLYPPNGLVLKIEAYAFANLDVVSASSYEY